MDIFRDDLLKNKYFIYALVVGGLLYGLLLLQKYNSVEARCERHVKQISSFINVGGNKLTEMELSSASRSLIEECIKKGGPDKN